MKNIEEQCLEIIRLLETNTEVYDLKINDVPVWWFIRFRFYEILYNSLEFEEKGKEIFRYKNLSPKKAKFFYLKRTLIFLARSLVGILSVILHRGKKKAIIFLVYSVNQREFRNGAGIDVFMDPIFRKLSDKSLLIEQATLTDKDAFSLFHHRKEVVFSDWAILLAIIKCILKIKRPPKITNWRTFEDRCQKIDFKKIPSAWIIETMKETINLNANKIIIQLKAAEIIIKTFRPKVIIETVSYNAGTMAFNFLAKKESVSIIELQHGATTRFDMGYNYLIPVKNEKQDPLPDKILVYGNFFKRTILRTGNVFSPENIKVVGLARLTNFLNENKSKQKFIRKEIRRKLGIDEDNFVITITSHSLFSNFICKFLKDSLPLLDKKVIICIKLHPVDDIKNEEKIYEGIIHHPKVKIVTDETVPLYQLLISSDLHVTISSTVFLECLALEVPNIIIDAEKKFSSTFSEIASQKKIITADNPEDFSNKVKEFITSRTLRYDYIKSGKELADYFFDTAGNVEGNIIEEINKFL